MTSYRFIVNPISGRGAGGQAVPVIERMAGSQGLDFEVVCTECPGHGIELAREAVLSGRDVIVAVGGDGTANEVLNGMMQASTGASALGVLAVGRGNDFAFGLGVPVGLEAGFNTLVGGQRRSLDVGRVVGGLYPQGRYFGNGVGIGFDAVVGFEALKLTWLSGFPSYIVAALKTIFLYFHAPVVRIEYDDQELVLPALMVSIMNGRRMGGGFMMAPDALTSDGRLDLCIARQVSRAQIFALIPKFMKGIQAGHPAIQTCQAKVVRVTAVEGILPAHADGETLCIDGKELSVELLPGQLEVIA